MPGVRDFLLRLRPAAAPGAAGAAGVPVDVKRQAEDELEPVFAALAPALARARDVRERASRQAAAEISRAREEARVLLDRARSDAAAERARVAAELLAQAEQEVSGFLRRARDEAAAAQREAERRRPDLVAQIVQRVRRRLSGVDGGGV